MNNNFTDLPLKEEKESDFVPYVTPGSVVEVDKGRHFTKYENIIIKKIPESFFTQRNNTGSFGKKMALPKNS